MEPVVVAKILQEALRASWNFSSAHWLHHPMNVTKTILILKISTANICSLLMRGRNYSDIENLLLFYFLIKTIPVFKRKCTI